MMKIVKPQTVVIGAGITGLTAAIRLSESGIDTEIWTKELPEKTNSATAAAFWEPYIVKPAAEAARWGAVSFDVFAEEFSAHGSRIGIDKRHLFSIFRDYPDLPTWASVVPTFRRLSRDALEEHYEGNLPEEFIYGFAFETWMIEMHTYLLYLQKRFERNGRIIQREVDTIDKVFAVTDLVINCSGLGSRDIEGIDDATVYPVAGQVVQMPRTNEQSILFDTLGAEPEKPTYIVARGDNVILGGTAIVDLFDRTPSAEVTADIVDRCRRFCPYLDVKDVQIEKVGLRPARPTVRLEHEEYKPRKHLIHNYGHGGAGVTLSWGCAEDVLHHIQRIHSLAKTTEFVSS